MICGPETISSGNSCSWGLEDQMAVPGEQQYTTYTIPLVPMVADECKGLETYHLYTDDNQDHSDF